jgi:oxygen-independent coproporphyrinogen-3 oxidase
MAAEQQKMAKTGGIYIHIPFCKQACAYCNFHFSTSLKYKGEVFAAILKELEMRRDYLADSSVGTIYLGGGTPSLLSADEIKQIYDTIQKYYKAESVVEFTLEANPDDLTRDYIRSLRHTPVDRFSIGVQSFRDEDLAYMNRAHNASQADYAIKAAQDAGFTNITIDLIYGTPGLTDTAWKENIAKIKELGIPHFSSYALTVEEKTALYHAIAKKKSAPVDPEQSAGQFEILMERAAAMGFEQYEISNFALPGHHAVHNTNYWRGLPYLGIGPSAHSFNGTARGSNIANNIKYTDSILREGKLPFEEEILTAVQQLNEYIMTSLRTMWGCDLEKISSTWDSGAAQKVEKSSHLFQEKNWLRQDGNKLILTPAGKLFADRIAAEMFVG